MCKLHYTDLLWQQIRVVELGLRWWLAWLSGSALDQRSYLVYVGPG